MDIIPSLHQTEACRIISQPRFDVVWIKYSATLFWWRELTPHNLIHWIHFLMCWVIDFHILAWIILSRKLLMIIDVLYEHIKSHDPHILTFPHKNQICCTQMSYMPGSKSLIPNGIQVLYPQDVGVFSWDLLLIVYQF